MVPKNIAVIIRECQISSDRILLPTSVLLKQIRNLLDHVVGTLRHQNGSQGQKMSCRYQELKVQNCCQYDYDSLIFIFLASCHPSILLTFLLLPPWLCSSESLLHVVGKMPANIFKFIFNLEGPKKELLFPSVQLSFKGRIPIGIIRVTCSYPRTVRVQENRIL